MSINIFHTQHIIACYGFLCPIEKKGIVAVVDYNSDRPAGG
jgi:hypothetical protein